MDDMLKSSPVFARGYLASAKGGELLKRLEATHDVLRRMEQSSDEAGGAVAGLDNVAAGLVSASVLHNGEAEVRLLACAGLVDVLRVYAPDAPYTDAQLLVRAADRCPRRAGTGAAARARHSHARGL
jgi:hypothetical protein